MRTSEVQSDTWKFVLTLVNSDIHGYVPHIEIYTGESLHLELG